MKTANEVQPPPVAVEYAREVRKRLGDHVRHIILFGSQARGEANKGSDYDFIVVVDQRTRALRDLVSEVGDKMLDEHEELCAALFYDEKEWELVCGAPLGWNVEREGIVL